MGLLNKDIKEVKIERFNQMFRTVWEDDPINFFEDEHSFAAVNLLKYALKEQKLMYHLLGLQTDDPTKGLHEMLRRLITSAIHLSTSAFIKCGCTNHTVLIDAKEAYRQANITISRIGMTVDIENDKDIRYGRCIITINGIPHSKYIFE